MNTIINMKLSENNNMDSPLLMLPFDQETSFNLSLFNLENKKTFTPNSLKNIQDSNFIGSSHGWLLFLDHKSNPFLLNPFSNYRIRLPEKQTLPNIHQVQEIDNGTFQVGYKLGEPCYYSFKNYGQLMINKAVLSSNPACNRNYAVVVIYRAQCRTRLAFCRHGDQVWRDLEGKLDTYYDIVCSDITGMLFALGPGPSVEVWDLNEPIPTRRMLVDQDSCPRKLMQDSENFPSDLYSSQLYVALSTSGHIYLVVRYIGEFVRPYDGQVVYEGDTLTDYASEPLVCPYKTVRFQVYKLDLENRGWTEVASLDDKALFLGGNHSMEVSIEKYPGLKGNSIYFTDDYWDRIDEDESYGGHDMGIYNMEDGSIEPILELHDQQKIEPPPFWVTSCSSSSSSL